MSASEHTVRKALVTLAIETILLRIGKPAYDEIIGRLYSDYKCYFPDCYEHPEYLKKILDDIYGKCSSTIVESIKKQLEGFETQNGIDTFIARISE